MKINFPISCNNHFLSTKMKSVFTPISPPFLNHLNNYSYFIPSSNNFKNFNTYADLYSKIISRDKSALNPFKKETKNSFKYKPFYTNLKIIYNEDNDSNKNSLDEENEKKQDEKFLGKKTEREKDNKSDLFEVNKSTSTNNESFSIKTKRGRKKKEVKEKGDHTKFKDDNMMRKIKCHFFNHINYILNDSLKNKSLCFLKLDNFINENLKRDYNVELMHRTIKDIYMISKISNKYKKKNNENNKKLVEKIYLENIESDTIKILNKTYYELFTELIKDKLDEFCGEILKKEEKNGLPHEQTITFSDKMKNLCINYKEWFETKIGRGGKIIKS